VTPRGEIIAVPRRGAWQGNRGRLLEGRDARDIVRSHQSKAWITCRLEFKGRHAPQCTLNSTDRLCISGSDTFGFP
jgi:hypothetical protein